jgi:hypothetical protein
MELQGAHHSGTARANPTRFLYSNCECLDVTKEQLGRTETAGMRCLRAIAGYGMADHKHNEDMEDNRHQYSGRDCRKKWTVRL